MGILAGPFSIFRGSCHKESMQDLPSRLGNGAFKYIYL